MRVLLIAANTETINMTVLPLGLACVAQATQAAGHDVMLLDLLGEEEPRQALKTAILEFLPELIGISVRNIDDQRMEPPVFLLEQVKDVVDDCRSHSGSPIVLGGAGYSIFPVSALNYLGADMGICGEGEKTFVSLLERLTRDEDLSGVSGLYLLGKGLQGKVTYTKHLDDVPLPRSDSYPLPLSEALCQEIWMPFQTRRGCPMRCSYCSTGAIEGELIRKRSLDQVVDAISHYVAAGIDKFYFVDNTFNLPPSYAKALCKRLILSGLHISWRCILYPKNIDHELIELMSKAGCDEVSLGFESGSVEILQRMNKRFDPESVRQISKQLKNSGIRQLGFLLLGGPGETKMTVEESLLFADSLELEAVRVTLGIRIYPNTSLARRAVKDGMVSQDDDLLYPRYYLVKEIRGWLRKTVNRVMAERPNWIC